jgi:hypothetical protein
VFRKLELELADSGGNDPGGGVEQCGHLNEAQVHGVVLVCHGGVELVLGLRVVNIQLEVLS